MIEKTSESIISTLFGTYGTDRKNTDLLNKTISDIVTTNSQEIGLAAKQISSIYAQLSKSEGEEVLKGFREYVQQLALSYDTKTSTSTTLLWKEMLDNGDKQTLATLFKNYASIYENDKELGNLLMEQAVNTYEKFGYNTASNFVSSVNQIFSKANEDNLKDTLTEFSSIWKTISNLEDISLEQRQDTLNNFAESIINSNSFETIQDTIETYKNDFA